MSDLEFDFSYAYAYGLPLVSANLKTVAEDFFVAEELGFVPSGGGEHIWLYLEKIGQNTEWLAKQLARFAAVRPMDVSYSGLKDRNAVARQWFSIYRPKGDSLDWSAFSIEGVKILETTRHERKLKRGTHQSNRFTIVLRELQGPIDTLEARIQQLQESGVPNYFGDQRFGKERNNLTNAVLNFSGKRHLKDKFQRGLLLSAARAYLFNQVLSARVADKSWNRVLDGDVFTLSSNGASFYLSNESSAEQRADVEQRLKTGDIHISGPLWGDGAPLSQAQAASCEQQAMAPYALLQQGLSSARLKHERRPLRLLAKNFQWQIADYDKLVCEFTLPPGSYATMVLRELINIKENDVTFRE